MNPVSVYPLPLPPEKYRSLAFAVCSIPSETDADDIPVELVSPSRSIVVAMVRGEGFRRLDVDSVSLNGSRVRAFVLGHDSIECGVGSYEAVRLAWLSLYIPALNRGTDPAKLEFGTFSVSTAE